MPKNLKVSIFSIAGNLCSNGIRIEKINKIGASVYYENVSYFDCLSKIGYDPFTGEYLVKLEDGLYKATGNSEIFIICDPKLNITTYSSTKSGNYFDMYFKKINNTTIEVEI